MNLTPHFTLAEMCHTEQPVPNIPSSDQIINIKVLCEQVLEPVRMHFNRPVKVLSGYRNPTVNRRVGGAPTSQHLNGEAADIRVQDVSNADVWRFIVNVLKDFDQCIAERLSVKDGKVGWIHVTYGLILRREALSSPKKGVYLPGLVYKD